MKYHFSRNYEGRPWPPPICWEPPKSPILNRAKGNIIIHYVIDLVGSTGST